MAADLAWGRRADYPLVRCSLAYRALAHGPRMRELVRSTGLPTID